MGQIGGQPIFILPEGTLRSKGRNAQENNIAAARAIADAVRTTLGPKGMDKMLVDSIGDIVITNDGVTILEEMEIEHPAAKMMVEVAKTQNEEVGDGTTSAVVIAGELLRKAGELLDQNIHSTVIIRGYNLARDHALKTLDRISSPVTVSDKDTLKKIVLTSMSGKSGYGYSEKLADLVVEAVTQVAEKKGNKISVNIDDIKREKKHGGSLDETELIKGIVIDKEVVHPGMPKEINNAKIALLDAALEFKSSETDTQIQITDPSKLQAFVEQEERILKKMVDDVVKSGATVLVCQKGIDDVAQHYLSKKGILAVRRVKKSDMEKLAKATGGRIVTSLNDLSDKDLGFAKLVEEQKIGDEDMVFVRECKNPKAVTILVRGGTEHVVDEIDRAIEDAIGAVSSSIEVGKIVPGGGAPEAEVARELRKYAEGFSGREQLAITSFADAMEVIPRSLAENGGLDPIDTLVSLRSEHDKKNQQMGVNVLNGGVMDMLNAGVIEPVKIKTQAIKSATEAAEMILRIDDVISASKLNKGMPSMPPGGMGGPGMEDY
ncbi:MAG: thermosome subunit [Candidatus Aenigmarchaeota archaeon CG_4_10_14_0_8_um_filter_37_24]|nr:thermosome subunit [Candidatus Aenigmarchaeota archaeon]OIN87880.1 MAG: thermosome subunit [Candidatus Aenigmarchaeota archaeon CG1_02_38_14]PIV69268.1 MAG: thermosome subunit [Candidatus Aenigmarchaeota archaeon CG01_land_8_20_14_3_00_37_9]PIW41209.1 MAG: thermosome subunit [Candidatus Aenigmarchaeota archaeon CG15_BIG_FIL_POST_REV_8_21_14_020_37_27]PIX50752.1 MAG: thermosome subunit [Candidatus Aenigmarchaeota archaeon CG_4_8_14_3_um_filter_37_24]PIY35081.1 MAG: thermosome subunit [Candid